jgi:tetratricopeptide (TPR) repeat protein
VQADYVRNRTAALQTYREMLDAARGGRLALPEISEVNARLGMAEQMDALCRTTNAIEELRTVIVQKPAAPYASLARAHYQMGVTLDRAGRRSEAIAAYQHARAMTPSDDRLRLRDRSRSAIDRAPVSHTCR